MYENLEDAAFSSFDPNVDMGSNFDPDMLTGKPRMAGRRPSSIVRTSPQQVVAFGGPQPTASFTINITNTGSVTQGVELFNSLYSISKIANNSLYPSYQPLLSLPSSGYPVEPDPAGTALILLGYLRNINPSGGNSRSIGFSEDGSLVFVNAAGDPTTITCNEVPYRAMLDMLMGGSFRIDKMRMTFKTVNQIAESITWRDKTFLGGEKQQTINPNNYFRPDQFQSLRVDVPVPIAIDRQKGLFFRVLGEETISITFFISQYAKNMI